MASRVAALRRSVRSVARYGITLNEEVNHDSHLRASGRKRSRKAGPIASTWASAVADRVRQRVVAVALDSVAERDLAAAGEELGACRGRGVRAERVHREAIAVEDDARVV